MPIRLLAVLCVCAFGVATTAAAQTKPRIEKAADLPRFSYRIDGNIEDVLRDDAKFGRFAADIRRDTESVLNGYRIDDRATLRQLEGELAQLDFLEGRHEAALARAARIRQLQEKPADKLMSGLQLRAMIEAQRTAGDRTSTAYLAETGRLIDAELARMPFDVVQNEVREAKAAAEISSEALTLGYLRSVIQPTVDKAGALSSDFAPIVVSAKYRLVASLPLKRTLIDTYGRYLAAHKVEKPDIWAARDAPLAGGKPYAPVKIAVWDSGVDSALFSDRLVKDADKPALIAFDRYAKPATGELQAIPPELKERVATLKSRLKGFSDLQSNIDSPEASEMKQYLSGLEPDEYKGVVEELGLASSWMHGTHVAGIAMAGNPYARLVMARIEFDWHLLPDPCPGRELVERDALAAKILAVNPKLTPPEVIKLIRDTSDKTADGRRTLVDPKKALHEIVWTP